MKQFCLACREVVADPVKHETWPRHQRNDRAWRVWMRIERAIAMVAPAPCAPRWRSVA